MSEKKFYDFVARFELGDDSIGIEMTIHMDMTVFDEFMATADDVTRSDMLEAARRALAEFLTRALSKRVAALHSVAVDQVHLVSADLLQERVEKWID